MRECEACEGTGWISEQIESDAAPIQMQCEACEGKGAVLVYPKGTGKVIKELMDRLEDSGAATRGNPSQQVAVVKLEDVPAIEEEE